MTKCVECTAHLTKVDLLSSVASRAVVREYYDDIELGLPAAPGDPNTLSSVLALAPGNTLHLLCSLCGQQFDYLSASKSSLLCSFCLLMAVFDYSTKVKNKKTFMRVYGAVISVVDTLAGTLSRSLSDAELKHMILITTDRQLKIALMEQLKQRASYGGVDV